MLTARGLTQDRIEGYKSGADSYLSKPFDPEELECIVESCLERSKRDVVGGLENKGADVSALQASIDEIKDILTSSRSVTGESKVAILTPKEKLVLEGVSEGRMNKEIAADMGISVRSVERHVTNLLEKAGKGSRTELLRWAVEEGLVEI